MKPAKKSGTGKRHTRGNKFMNSLKKTDQSKEKRKKIKINRFQTDLFYEEFDKLAKKPAPAIGAQFKKCRINITHKIMKVFGVAMRTIVLARKKKIDDALYHGVNIDSDSSDAPEFKAKWNPPKEGVAIPSSRAFFMKMWLASERCKVFVKNFECNKPEFVKYKEGREKEKRDKKKTLQRLRFIKQSRASINPTPVPKPAEKKSSHLNSNRSHRSLKSSKKSNLSLSPKKQHSQSQAGTQSAATLPKLNSTQSQALLLMHSNQGSLKEVPSPTQIKDDQSTKFKIKLEMPTVEQQIKLNQVRLAEHRESLRQTQNLIVLMGTMTDDSEKYTNLLDKKTKLIREIDQFEASNIRLKTESDFPLSNTEATPKPAVNFIPTFPPVDPSKVPPPLKLDPFFGLPSNLKTTFTSLPKVKSPQVKSMAHSPTDLGKKTHPKQFYPLKTRQDCEKYERKLSQDRFNYLMLDITMRAGWNKPEKKEKKKSKLAMWASKDDDKPPVEVRKFALRAMHEEETEQTWSLTHGNSRRHRLASEARKKFEASENLGNQVYHLSPYSGNRSSSVLTELQETMMKEAHSPMNSTMRVLDPTIKFNTHKNLNPLSAKCLSKVLFQTNSKHHEISPSISHSPTPREANSSFHERVPTLDLEKKKTLYEKQAKMELSSIQKHMESLWLQKAEYMEAHEANVAKTGSNGKIASSRIARMENLRQMLKFEEDAFKILKVGKAPEQESIKSVKRLKKFKLDQRIQEFNSQRLQEQENTDIVKIVERNSEDENELYRKNSRTPTQGNLSQLDENFNLLTADSQKGFRNKKSSVVLQLMQLNKQSTEGLLQSPDLDAESRKNLYTPCRSPSPIHNLNHVDTLKDLRGEPRLVEVSSMQKDLPISPSNAAIYSQEVPLEKNNDLLQNTQYADTRASHTRFRTSAPSPLGLGSMSRTSFQNPLSGSLDNFHHNQSHQLPSRNRFALHTNASRAKQNTQKALFSSHLKNHFNQQKARVHSMGELCRYSGIREPSQEAVRDSSLVMRNGHLSLLTQVQVEPSYKVLSSESTMAEALKSRSSFNKSKTQFTKNLKKPGKLGLKNSEISGVQDLKNALKTRLFQQRMTTASKNNHTLKQY